MQKAHAHIVFSLVLLNLDASFAHYICFINFDADGISRFKTSRINLVDLAGSERQKLTGAAWEHLKEAGNINCSLSQPGNLINILAEVSQTGKQRHIPYRDSRLTFLLQESLGGNAKLAMICAVSPAQSRKSETFSTLRFAQRAKAIKNKAVVNEVMQDDVNYLCEVIRQLRLCFLKANGQNLTATNGGCSAGWARRSLNILKCSLHHPMTLPHIDDDGDEEMEIDEDAVEKICDHVDMQLAGLSNGTVMNHTTKEQNDEGISNSLSADSHVRDSSVQLPEEKKALSSSVSGLPDKGSLRNSVRHGSSCPISDPLAGFSREISGEDMPDESGNGFVNCVSPSCLSIVRTDGSLVLKSATPSVSPRINNSRKSLRTSSMLSASQKDLNDDNKNPVATTEHLAATLHRGLEIIDSHHRSSGLRRSSFRFSLRPADFKLVLPVAKVDLDVKERNESSNLQLVPFDDSQSADKSMKQVPKVSSGEGFAGAIRREMALGDFCAEQTSKIKHLNCLVYFLLVLPTDSNDYIMLSFSSFFVFSLLTFFCISLTVQQYKHERECNAIIGQTREGKILRPESLMDGVLPTEEFMEEEFVSLMHEHKSQPKIVLRRFEQERIHWTEAESKWISLAEELMIELEASRSLAEKQKQELDAEKQWTEELKEAMQMAMEGHARMLEQYADLEEKHIQSLARHRKIQEGIDDVNKAATRAGVMGAESKFINALAAEISALKVEKKRGDISVMRIKGFTLNCGILLKLYKPQASTFTTQRSRRNCCSCPGVPPALVYRNCITCYVMGILLYLGGFMSTKRAIEAEQETAKACKQIDQSKKKHEIDSRTLNEIIAESRLPKEAIQPVYNDSDVAKYDVEEPHDEGDQQWREEFKPFYTEESELSKFAESSSWFSGYDRCNI
ncbi:hypothetical protein Pint_25617 [Pistacia integerrima]|uniref:Uncharacterized protein n=1 Tax=Pistacia integerrima TaxID=434235 RepID=A0ACC0YH15_9ROSI|nr:hypothetical protein Pint_25617 [Pistacia integerrima]